MKTKRILPLQGPIGSVLLVAIALFAFGLGLATSAEARITRVVITETQSPTFVGPAGGYSWPGVGQYEKIVGTAYGELNPHDHKNKVIVDIEFAPRNASGKVEYSFAFYILKPIDLSKGAHKVMYEPPNRGGKTWATLGRVSCGTSVGCTTNNPGSITDPTVLANSLLMPRGYTMVWSGWDFAAGTSTANYNSWIALPIAKYPPTTPENPDGTITGPMYEYIVTSGASYPLTYTAATLDKTQAKLTHRVHLDDPPGEIPASGWNYNATGTAISLVGGNFVANDIYEFSYTAKNPTVNGVGFAAIRDWNAWLRYEAADDFGQSNPLYRDIRRIYTETSSQSARTLNDFRNLGFNQAENGKKVFDGMMQWIGAGDGVNMNYRFSNPGTTERNRQHHLYIEGVFPFANVMTTDPFTGKRDSRYARCEATGTCPLAAEIYSSNEYWVKAASLLHTDPAGPKGWDHHHPGYLHHPIRGGDLPDSPFTRNYLISSHQHGGGGGTPSLGSCQQLSNQLSSAPVQRALFIALDEWSTKGTKPPDSRVPKFSDGTLVPPSEVGFPTNIPSVYLTPTGFVTYTGLKTTRYLLNYGPDFYETGIATINPPVIHLPYEDNPLNGPIYPSFVPKTDSDGNDIAGVRLGDVTVPLATYTGWALRSGVWANDGCEGTGQYIPFAKSLVDRTTSGDPRPSIEERYPTFHHYQHRVVHAIKEMLEDRLILCEDADTEAARLITAGLAKGVPPPDGNLPPPPLPSFCQNPEKHTGHGFYPWQDHHGEWHDGEKHDGEFHHGGEEARR